MRPILIKPVLVVPVGSHARRGNPIIGSAPVGTLVRRIGDAEGAAAFSPDDLAGLEGWWKADSLVLADGDPVATWIDSSGNGRDVTQGTAASKPTYQTGELNGLPVVRYDGVDDYLENTSFPNAADEYTVFVVAKLDATDAAQAILGDLSDAPGDVDWYFFNDGGTTYWRVQDSAGQKEDTYATDLRGAFHIYVGLVDGSTSFLYTDGVERDTVAYSSPNAITSSILRLGQIRVSTGYSLTGDQAEVIIYSRALSTSEREQVEAYLQDKYGL
jgi:concanavalin A-like lectin/glucanase superfamily protein